jgi:ubiquinol-cytochrome c reductase subunit 8
LAREIDRINIEGLATDVELGLLRLLRIAVMGEIEELGLMLSTIGSQTQKGVATYALSANRQRPLAGTLNAAIFNTWRRFSHQVLYFAPPLVIAYVTMQWAIEKSVLLRRFEAAFADCMQKRVLEF